MTSPPNARVRATFIGGAGHFVGPILGAVLVTYLQNMLSDVTEVWQLYFGLMFIATVMYAPGGLAGLVMMHGPIWRAGALAGVPDVIRYSSAIVGVIGYFAARKSVFIGVVCGEIFVLAGTWLMS